MARIRVPRRWVAAILGLMTTACATTPPSPTGRKANCADVEYGTVPSRTLETKRYAQLEEFCADKSTSDFVGGDHKTGVN